MPDGLQTALKALKWENVCVGDYQLRKWERLTFPSVEDGYGSISQGNQHTALHVARGQTNRSHT